MPSLLVFGQSHLAVRLGELTRQLGIEARAVPLDPPGPRMARAWQGRLSPEGAREDPDFPASLPLDGASAALFCATEDAVNLSLALEVRDAHPDLHLVVSFFDLRLGRKIQQELGNCAVLSAAEVSAPRFAAAAVCAGVLQTVAHGGRVYAFQDTPQGLACEPLLAPAGSREDGPATSALDAALPRPPWRADRYLLGMLALIAAVLGAATAYFHAAQHLPWMSALYFVVTTFCTVGYGDFSLREASDLDKLAGIVLMLASVTLTAGLFAILTNALVGLRLDAQEGRRRHRLRGHVLVCGLGSLGLRVAECLQGLGAKVLVLERDRANPLLEDLAARRIPHMVADASRVGALRAAGIARARTLVCTLNDDLEGLEIGLAARAARPGLHVVLRIFDGGFADRIERHFHIHTALSASNLAAPFFLARALHPAAHTLVAGVGGWQVVAERAPQAEPWPGERLLVAGEKLLVMTPLAGFAG